VEQASACGPQPDQPKSYAAVHAFYVREAIWNAGQKLAVEVLSGCDWFGHRS
jgi:hypothetical protein